MVLEAMGTFTRRITTVVFTGKETTELESDRQDDVAPADTVTPTTPSDTADNVQSPCNDLPLPSAAAELEATLRKDLKALKRKLRSAKKRYNQLSHDFEDVSGDLEEERLRSASLERELKETRRDLEKEKACSDTLVSQAKREAESTIRYLEGESERNSSEASRFRGKLFEARQACEQAETAVARTQAKLIDVQNQYNALQTKVEQKEALYAAQSLELRTAQTYLNTTDSVPGAQVIQAVRDLNSEIQNAAPMFAEEFHFATPESVDSDSQDFGEAVTILENGGDIGNRLMQALCTSNNSEDPTLIQTAIQAMLTSAAARCISTFFESDQNVVKTLHAAIRENEVQAISGRWRALSARHIRLCSPDPTNSGKAQAEALLLPLTALFMISACIDSPTEISDTVTEKFTTKLCTIMSQALNLGTLIYEEVTSTDYEIVHIPAETPFDPSTADDEYADKDSDTPVAQPILCTLELGLRQITVTQGSESNGSGKGRTETLLLKPKIALESAIDTILA